MSKISPCVKCGIPIKPDAHWTILHCSDATKREWKKQYQARLDFINHLLWGKDQQVQHWASIIRFQQWKLFTAINSGNEEQAAISAKEIFTAGRELLKEAKLWSEV